LRQLRTNTNTCTVQVMTAGGVSSHTANEALLAGCVLASSQLEDHLHNHATWHPSLFTNPISHLLTCHGSSAHSLAPCLLLGRLTGSEALYIRLLLPACALLVLLAGELLRHLLPIAPPLLFPLLLLLSVSASTSSAVMSSSVSIAASGLPLLLLLPLPVLLVLTDGVGLSLSRVRIM
jgi:hypothetical protein